MTNIEHGGKTYELCEIKFGQWRRLLKLRKEATESKDEYRMAEALAVWIKSVITISDADLDALSLEDALKLLQKVSEAQTLPLPPDEKLGEQSSQEIPVS